MAITVPVPVGNPVLLGDGACLLLTEKLALLPGDLDCMILWYLGFFIAGTLEKAQLDRREEILTVKSMNVVNRPSCEAAGTQNVVCLANSPQATFNIL